MNRFAFLLILLPCTGLSQIFELDPDFGEAGILHIDEFGFDLKTEALAMFPDGHFCIGGSFIQTEPTLEIASIAGAFDENGTSISSFGDAGWVFDDLGNDLISIIDIAPGPENSLFVTGVGSLNFETIPLVWKLTETGDLDTSFGDNGVATFELPSGNQPEILDIEVDPFGLPFVSGTFNPSSDIFTLASFVVKFDANGNLDASFSGDGIKEIIKDDQERVFISLSFREDGSMILLAMADLVPNILFKHPILYSFLPDGSTDHDFIGSGSIITMTEYKKGDPKGGHFDEQGRYVYFGEFTGIGMPESHFIARVHSDGEPDLSFAKTEYLMIDEGMEFYDLVDFISYGDQLIFLHHFLINYEEIAFSRILDEGLVDETVGTDGFAKFTLLPDKVLNKLRLAKFPGGQLLVSAEASSLGEYDQAVAARFDTDISSAAFSIESSPIEMTVFPNPVTESIGLQILSQENLELNLNLFDSSGRFIQNLGWQHVKSGSNLIQLERNPDIPNGIYFLQCRTSKLSQAIPVIFE